MQEKITNLLCALLVQTVYSIACTYIQDLTWIGYKFQISLSRTRSLQDLFAKDGICKIKYNAILDPRNKSKPPTDKSGRVKLQIYISIAQGGFRILGESTFEPMPNAKSRSLFLCPFPVVAGLG